MDAPVNAVSGVRLDFIGVWASAYQNDARTIPAGVLANAHRVWFDTLACIAGGAGERCTAAALKTCAGYSVGPVDEALVWGTASHALDYDDVCMLATCHPSAPVVSALLAILPTLEKTQCAPSLRDLLAAHVVGTETALRLGQWIGFGHYELGFHATSTLGVIGAAAGCAHLLQLPETQARTSLFIAASAAAGLRANFGTDTKPLHVGFAASSAVRAVLLAQAGATASEDSLKPAGFVRSFSGAAALPPLSWKTGDTWALQSPGFEIKRFPSCYLTHRMIAGIKKIRAKHAPTLDDAPVNIHIEFPKGGTAPLKHPWPHTGLEGKFSAPYCAASAWVDGGIDLASFSDEAVQRPRIHAQMNKVSVEERAESHGGLETAPVYVRVSGTGWAEMACVDWAPGSSQDPLTDADLLRKWTDCMAHGAVSLARSSGEALLHAEGSQPAAALLASFRVAVMERISAAASGQLPGLRTPA
ncbi:MAG: MmgE/PrpD family protein [Polaromonas sp.]